MSEWREEVLDNLVVVDPEQLSPLTDEDFTFFYIDISSVSEGHIDYPISQIEYKGSPSRARKILKINDVLMSTVRPNLKSFAKFNRVSRFNFVASTGFAILRAKKETDIDYIYHSLFSEKVERQIQTLVVGSNYPAINSSDVRKLVFNVPDYHTQRRIARILSTADAIIKKTQAAIVKNKAIKQGMLHDLFTRGIDTQTGKLRPKYQDAPELYKESKLGWIPKEWEVERFEDISVDAILGITVRGTSSNEENIPLLKMGNLVWSELILNHVEYVMSSAIETERYLLKHRDFLFNTRNTPELVGKTAIWRQEFPIATFDNNLLRIRFIKEIASPFVCYFMSFGKGRNNIKLLVDGTTSVAAVYWKNLKEYKIPFPDINEQEEIIKRLESIDNKIQTERNYLHKLQQIKSGLMADLLSGKKMPKYQIENK
jgi:type I restriction enzyme, S subunit